MGTNCTPHVADLFLFCYEYERDFMMSLSVENQFEITEAFSSTKIFGWFIEYWQYLLRWFIQSNLPPELHLNKANSSDIKAAFSDIHLSLVDRFVSSKIYDKRNDFDFEIVNFPFLDGDVPRAASYGVYISQLIRFARVCSHVTDFNTRNKLLTAKLLNQSYRFINYVKPFLSFIDVIPI